MAAVLVAMKSHIVLLEMPANMHWHMNMFLDSYESDPHHHGHRAAVYLRRQVELLGHLRKPKFVVGSEFAVYIVPPTLPSLLSSKV
jgi:hypothetical protein